MNLIKKIKKSKFGEYAVSKYHCVASWLYPKLVSDKKAVVRYYRKKSGGQTVDLQNPRKFSEKLQWYKLNAKNPLMQTCADKVAVRDYLKDIGYEHLLNDVHGVFDRVKDIKWKDLPDQYVIKAAHGSGQNIIVSDKSKLDVRHAKRMLNSWLNQDISWSGREWVYKGMPRRIIIEKFLKDETGELRDYKFFCFNGKPTFMQLEVGRYTEHNTRNFYDMDWNLMPFGKEIPHNPNIIVQKPEMFEEMKEIALQLSKPFQFVRVDLYQVMGKIYFGELTFFPAGGAPDFVPACYDEIVGSYWKLKE